MEAAIAAIIGGLFSLAAVWLKEHLERQGLAPPHPRPGGASGVQPKVALCDKLEAATSAAEGYAEQVSAAILQEVFNG